MLPKLFLSPCLMGIVRSGCVLGALTLVLSVGCSHLGTKEPKLHVAPTLEMGRQLPERGGESEPFALTNEGRRIEENLLRQRKVLLPE